MHDRNVNLFIMITITIVIIMTIIMMVGLFSDTYGNMLYYRNQKQFNTTMGVVFRTEKIGG